MRNYHRLPPLLRVASVLGLLFPLTSLPLLAAGLIEIRSNQPPMESVRVMVIALNLMALGVACTSIVNAYSMRFHQTAREPFPLDGWRRQARAIVLVASPPLCDITLAVVISPTSSVFELVFAVLGLTVFTLLVFTVWVAIRTTPALTGLPPT